MREWLNRKRDHQILNAVCFFIGLFRFNESERYEGPKPKVSIH